MIDNTRKPLSLLLGAMWYSSDSIFHSCSEIFPDFGGACCTGSMDTCQLHIFYLNIDINLGKVKTTKTKIYLRTFLLYLLAWISLPFCQSQANQLSHPAPHPSVCQLYETKFKQRLIFDPISSQTQDIFLGIIFTCENFGLGKKVQFYPSQIPTACF